MKYSHSSDLGQRKGFTWVLKKVILIALGVTMASHLVSGISYDSTVTLLVVVILFTLMNIVVKPLLILFALPFVVLTFGIGIWIINGFLFMFVSNIVDEFHVESFTAALWGALIVSIVSVLANTLLKSNAQPTITMLPDTKVKRNLDKSKEDVIDI